jgi:hypothetical protein
VSLAGYAAYVARVLLGAGPTPLPAVPYVAPLLWTTGGAIVASIFLHIAFALASPADRRRGAIHVDERDRAIARFGEYAGNSFVVVGAIAALVLAMAERAHFWIANVLYLAFVLAAVAGSIARIVAYRRGVPAA